MQRNHHHRRLAICVHECTLCVFGLRVCAMNCNAYPGLRLHRLSSLSTSMKRARSGVCMARLAEKEDGPGKPSPVGLEAYEDAIRYHSWILSGQGGDCSVRLLSSALQARGREALPSVPCYGNFVLGGENMYGIQSSPAFQCPSASSSAPTHVSGDMSTLLEDMPSGTHGQILTPYQLP